MLNETINEMIPESLDRRCDTPQSVPHAYVGHERDTVDGPSPPTKSGGSQPATSDGQLASVAYSRVHRSEFRQLV